MKKIHLMKVMPAMLAVACLLGMVALPGCSSSDSSASEEAVYEEPKYAVQIFIDCDQNLFFSKYDVDVKVDEEEIGNVEHGSESTFEVELTKGQHELELVKEVSTSPDGKTSFVVEGEGDKFAYNIHCTNDQIEIESIKEEAEEAEAQVVSYEGASIEVPGTWTVEDADGGKNAYPEYGGMVYLYASDFTLGHSTVDEVYTGFITTFQESEEYTISENVEKGKIGKAVTFKNEITLQVDEEHLSGEMELILTKDKMYSVMFVIPDSSYDQHSEDIASVFDSIELDKPTAPASSSNSKKKESKEVETTAEDANTTSKSGIFEYCYVNRPYRKTEYSYDYYYLFDEDTHVAVSLASDTPEDIATWPYRGNFNDSVEMDMIDDTGEVLTHWYVHWVAKDSPETLILIDDDGFETELESCPESEALAYFTDSMWENIGL